MRLAYIITCHRNAVQVERLINRLQYKDQTVFVLHVSKTSEPGFYEEIKTKLAHYTNVHFCKREDGTHNGWGIMKGIFNGLIYLQKHNIAYDYVSLLSGQDYPLKSNEYIFDFFERHKGIQFVKHFPLFPEPGDPYFTIHPWSKTQNRKFRVDRYNLKIGGVTQPIPDLTTGRHVDRPLWDTIKIFLVESPKYMREKRWWTEFQLLFYSRVLPYPRKQPPFKLYGGVTWWSITSDCANYVIHSYKHNHAMRKFYKYTLIPDEMYIPTMLMHSKYSKDCVDETLVEMDWVGGDGTHPIVFTKAHFPMLKRSERLYARKFDMVNHPEVLDMLDQLAAQR